MIHFFIKNLKEKIFISIFLSKFAEASPASGNIKLQVFITPI